MPIIQINNRNVHILEINKEATESIVMIHGMFTNLSVFYFNIANYISQNYHIVLYDLKSHGLSEKVKKGYNLRAMSEDLLNLTDKLELSKVHLTGYSFGGLIALYTAFNFPEKVNKIAIIDSPITDKDTDDIIEKYGNEFLDHYMQNYTLSTDLKPSKRQLEKNKRLYEFLLYETSMPQDLVLDKDFCKKDVIKSIKHEILLLYGNQSDCLKDGKYLDKYLPNSNFFEGEGDHNIPVQSPQWIGKMLSNFFNTKNGY